MVSVLILTKNEAADLPSCLASVGWSDDVHVFDSMSTDGTPDLALAAGAKVCQHAFEGYASQRNAALRICAFKYEWILVLDADERIPAASVAPILQAISTVSDSIAAFRLRRRDYFEGRWLRHAQMSPFYIRLFRKGYVSYHREVNEVVSVNGAVANAHIAFDHFPFSKGISYWMERHIRYARLEADRLVAETAGSFRFSWRKALCARDFHERRYHQKGLFYRMPCRPFLKWIYMVCIRGAFLDGGPGMRYTWLQIMYERLIDLHVREKCVSRWADQSSATNRFVSKSFKTPFI